MKNKLIFILTLISFLFPEDNLLNEIKNNAQKINTYPKNLNLAKSHERAGLIDEANLIYEQLFNSNPSNTHVFSSYKSFLYKQKKIDELMKISIIYSTETSPNPFGLLALADTYLLLGNETDAFSIFDSLFSENQADIKKLKRFTSKLLYYNKIDYAVSKILEIRKRYDYPDFYSLELGNYYSSKMSYEKSLKEYILFLDNNYDKYSFVRKRFMAFPQEDDVKLIIKNLLTIKPTKLKNKILSEYEFKWENYNAACKLILQNYFNEKELYDFSISMIKINEFDNAEKILDKLMKSENPEIVELSIYQLANILEKKAIQKNYYLPISNKIIEGSLFELKPFRYQKIDSKSNNLLKAITMYDSLIVHYNNSKAKFKIANFKLMTNRQNLSAINDFIELEKSATDKDVRFESAIKIIDINIENGIINQELINKIDNFKKIYKKNNQLNLLDLKRYQVLFFLNDFEPLTAELKEKLKTLDKDNSLYNEFLDGFTIIMLFNNMDDELSLFCNGILEIKKLNYLEALNIFLELKESNQQIIKNLSFYYLSYIYINLNELESARNLITELSGDDIFFQFILLMWAEIDDYVMNDINSAVDQYLEFLNEYQNSIFYEDVRIRLLGIIG